MAYDSIDPIGKMRDDFGWASICAVIVNSVRSIFRKEGESPKMVQPKDFMPVWGRYRKDGFKKPVQSVEEQKQILLTIARIHNKGREQRRKNVGSRNPDGLTRS